MIFLKKQTLPAADWENPKSPAGPELTMLLDLLGNDNSKETIALLKILELGNRQVEEGKVIPVSEALSRLQAIRKDN